MIVVGCNCLFPKFSQKPIDVYAMSSRTWDTARPSAILSRWSTPSSAGTAKWWPRVDAPQLFSVCQNWLVAFIPKCESRRNLISLKAATSLYYVHTLFYRWVARHLNLGQTHSWTFRSRPYNQLLRVLHLRNHKHRGCDVPRDSWRWVAAEDCGPKRSSHTELWSYLYISIHIYTYLYISDIFWPHLLLLTYLSPPSSQGKIPLKHHHLPHPWPRFVKTTCCSTSALARFSQRTKVTSWHPDDCRWLEVNHLYSLRKHSNI